MTVKELNERIATLINRFDKLTVRGTGWSGNGRNGIAFNIDAATGFGQAFGGPGDNQPPGGPGPGGGGPPGGGPGPVYPPPIHFDFGPCCIGGACTMSTSAQCASQGGEFHSDGDCAFASPCGLVGHAGACCAPGGSCSVVPAGECDGIYLGDDTSCEGADCSNRIACASAGGLYCACTYILGNPIPTCCGAPTPGVCLTEYHCATCSAFGTHYCCCCCLTIFGPACSA